MPGADGGRTTIGSSCQSCRSKVATETVSTRRRSGSGSPNSSAGRALGLRVGRGRDAERLHALVVEEEPPVEDLDLVLKHARVPVVERLGPFLAGERLPAHGHRLRPAHLGPDPGEAQVALLPGDHPARRLLDPRVEHRGGGPFGRVDDHAEPDAEHRRRQARADRATDQRGGEAAGEAGAQLTRRHVEVDGRGPGAQGMPGQPQRPHAGGEHGQR